MLSLLADLGGMEDALVFFLSPLVVSIAYRSFQYDLVTRHMKVKKRTQKLTKMPKEQINEKMAYQIFNLAGIHRIDKKKRNACFLIYCPFCCTRRVKFQKLTKLISRGTRQYGTATDILSMIRLNHRLKILES